MTFRVGDLVTVVWGAGESIEHVHAVVVEPGHGPLLDATGRLAVRPLTTTPGTWLRADLAQVRAGHIAAPTTPRHRHDDPDTAVQAAVAAGEHLTEHQWTVLTALVEAGPAGLIDHDHEARSGLIQTSAGKRRLELQHLGLVAPTDRKRETPTRQMARVYAVTAAGLALYQQHQRGAA